jgi:cytoskeletal protein CcmA (bactofilin family)
MSTDLDDSMREYHQNSSLRVASSVINSSTCVEGTISSSTDLRVDGQVHGVIDCGGVLYVSQGAVIDATVEASGIVVEGSLSGAILCRGRLEIRATGSVSAEVDTQRLVIHDGAVYQGRLRMNVETPATGTESSPPSSEVTASDDPEPPSNAYPYIRSFTPAPASPDQNDTDPPATDRADERD